MTDGSDRPDEALTLVQALAAMMADARRNGLPAQVRTSVRQRVLDTLGICVAASPLDTSAAIRRFALSQGGTPEASAVGIPGRLPAALAALVNGTLAHSLDYDDTHLPSVLHPSATIVPACLAAGQLALSPETLAELDGIAGAAGVKQS